MANKIPKGIVWKDIAQLDFRVESERKAIQDVLRRIKPLKKYVDVDVPIDKLEKTINVLTKKYNMFVRDIKPDCFANEESIIWHACIYDADNLSYYEMYGLTMYEVLAKTVVCMYCLREKVGERQG